MCDHKPKKFCIKRAMTCGLGHKEIVGLLLEREVDFTQPVRFKGKMRSYDGSPLDRAVEVGNDEIVRMIRQANGA
ncbi:ankyrin repeat domain-containing protein [Paenibacillus sp. JJ-223]|uniref:ankyrin repeat domain-containing protein n=1 Tax=Paenibacillus sp. JJ-223 TaxID=2905647 RepID=UPI001F316316|nr:ankyrin repeat domain-containing protein [Paenibacillus sp. JJ-223]CAH1217099.1 hypothetical protein PAECIP111890_04525 [Paenibacillus sp. JJ-223]